MTKITVDLPAGWTIEVRVADEMARGLIREDIIDVAYPPGDPRRYTDAGLEKMGLANQTREAP